MFAKIKKESNDPVSAFIRWLEGDMSAQLGLSGLGYNVIGWSSNYGEVWT